jgi:uncharacterized protein YjbI with pentapeptide repeats
MANEEHLARLKEGVAAWYNWRRAHPQVRPDLTKANLIGMDLRGVDLSGADLTEVTLTGTSLISANLIAADLTRATLYRAILIGAYLSDANLTQALLSEADLTNAWLEYTYLIRTDLYKAVLYRADLRSAILVKTSAKGAILDEAEIGRTTFGAVDLGEVRGLETVRHHGPSTISIDTFYLSRGNIPDVFLRGAGIPEDFITYMKSQVGRPFAFPSCFISYSSKDQEFADRLHADLQNNGVRCWFAPHDVQGGRKLHEQIDQAILDHERLLLILSPHSMNSEWVKTEIAKARQREVREQRQVLFPVRLVPFEAIRAWECFDADTGKDSAREIREYFIPDFSNWKNNDAYQVAFQRLLRDLKLNATLP